MTLKRVEPNGGRQRQEGCRYELERGRKVRINRGALSGLRGCVVQRRGSSRILIEVIPAGIGVFVLVDESLLSTVD